MDQQYRYAVPFPSVLHQGPISNVRNNSDVIPCSHLVPDEHSHIPTPTPFVWNNHQANARPQTIHRGNVGMSQMQLIPANQFPAFGRNSVIPDVGSQMLPNDYNHFSVADTGRQLQMPGYSLKPLRNEVRENPTTAPHTYPNQMMPPGFMPSVASVHAWAAFDDGSISMNTRPQSSVLPRLLASHHQTHEQLPSVHPANGRAAHLHQMMCCSIGSPSGPRTHESQEQKQRRIIDFVDSLMSPVNIGADSPGLPSMADPSSVLQTSMEHQTTSQQINTSFNCQQIVSPSSKNIDESSNRHKSIRLLHQPETSTASANKTRKKSVGKAVRQKISAPKRKHQKHSEMPPAKLAHVQQLGKEADARYTAKKKSDVFELEQELVHERKLANEMHSSTLLSISKKSKMMPKRDRESRSTMDDKKLAHVRKLGSASQKRYRAKASKLQKLLINDKRENAILGSRLRAHLSEYKRLYKIVLRLRMDAADLAQIQSDIRGFEEDI